VKRLIIADSHLGQSPGDIKDMIDLLGRAVAGGVAEVIYLGDAFQYLVGMTKFWTSAVREVLGTWKETRNSGVRVVIVEGNRDFFLDEADLAPAIDWSGTRYEFSSGSRAFRLEHGDKVNQRDFKYRFWSGVSKSAPARLWARLLPQRIAVAIVRSMEARLATTNLKFRYRMPIDALRKEAARAWDDGVDVLLWGHFHSLWQLPGENKLAMVVPAWLGRRVSVLVNPDGTWHFVDTGLTPVPEVRRMAPARTVG
jgi:UDP-2,3-diacylglucosamine pyrophosphatase LpxH